MVSVKLCLLYDHKDDELGQTLEKNLRFLKRKEYHELDLWSSRDISAGAQRDHEIESHLKAADIILLLLSPDFYFQDWYDKVEQAMERREDRGDYVIIPILLRDVAWATAFLMGFQTLPKNGKAVKTWKHQDTVWSTIVDDIREVIKKRVDREKPAPNTFVNEINSMFRPLAEEDETPFMFYPGVAHLGPVTCVLFACDGETLVSSDGMDHTINIWRVSHRQVQRQILGHSDQIYSIALSRDMHTLISAGQESTVRIWDFQTGQECRSPLEGHLGPISSVAISRDGKILVSAGDDGTIRTWKLPTGQRHRPPLEGRLNAVSSVAISRDGKILASGGYDNVVSLWEVSTGQCFRKLEGHKGTISSIAISPDMTTLASGSHDGTIRIWDFQTGQERCPPLVEPDSPHHSPVECVAFSPDGSILVSGGRDEIVRVWHWSTKRYQRIPKGHTGTISCVVFHPSKNLIASGGVDRIVGFWSWPEGRELFPPLAPHKTPIFSSEIVAKPSPSSRPPISRRMNILAGLIAVLVVVCISLIFLPTSRLYSLHVVPNSLSSHLHAVALQTPSPTITQDTSPAHMACSIVQKYYNAVNAKDYHTSYNIWLNQTESFDHFAKGYGSTLHDDISGPCVSVVSQNDGTVNVRITIRATERDSTGTITTHTYSATYVVKAVGGSWKFASGSISSVK